MFDDLRAAFKEALDNFNKELNRDQVADAADKLLVGMRNEIVEEKAHVAGLEEQLDTTRTEVAKLTDDAATARRRQKMARSIDDHETVRLAEEYVTRIETHVAVLEKKAAALDEELRFRRRTVEEMYTRFEEARKKRATLEATTGRTNARETISAASDLFDELDRMADKVEGAHAQAAAAREVGEIDLDEGPAYGIDLDDPAPEALDVDAALAELKRRMNDRS